jgi:hypothetical protein
MPVKGVISLIGLGHEGTADAIQPWICWPLAAKPVLPLPGDSWAEPEPPGPAAIPEGIDLSLAPARTRKLDDHALVKNRVLVGTSSSSQDLKNLKAADLLQFHPIVSARRLRSI